MTKETRPRPDELLIREAPDAPFFDAFDEQTFGEDPGRGFSGEDSYTPHPALVEDEPNSEYTLEEDLDNSQQQQQQQQEEDDDDDDDYLKWRDDRHYQTPCDESMMTSAVRNHKRRLDISIFCEVWEIFRKQLSEGILPSHSTIKTAAKKDETFLRFAVDNLTFESRLHLSLIHI